MIPPDTGRAEAEAHGLAQLAVSGGLIVAGVERALPGWIQRRVLELVEAWGGVVERERWDEVRAAAQVAGEQATTRVLATLRQLLTVDPDEQRATPLQIARTATWEPTALLRGLGVPEVVRDEHDERTWPDDAYGLVFASFAELGDDELAAQHLVWGVAKATVVRARHER